VRPHTTDPHTGMDTMQTAVAARRPVGDDKTGGHGHAARDGKVHLGPENIRTTARAGRTTGRLAAGERNSEPYTSGRCWTKKHN
jgi:hypothetical protein